MNATAIAHPNIALIKYWGDLLPELHIPANGSISMNLQELQTQMTVSFSASLPQDQLKINGETVLGEALTRVSHFLDRVRNLAGIASFAQVENSSDASGFLPIQARM